MTIKWSFSYNFFVKLSLCNAIQANKKNTCVSGSPTDPKNSGPTLNFFFPKKKSDFSYHKFARKLTKKWINQSKI